MNLINLSQPDQSTISFKFFNFPDGQPHYEFQAEQVLAAAAEPIEIITALKSGNDILNLGLVLDSLISVKADLLLNVTISYLLGARMDRRIAPGQPNTISVVASLLQSLSSKINKLRVLDPHSPEALKQVEATALSPIALIEAAVLTLSGIENRDLVLVAPDAGAVPRTKAIYDQLYLKPSVAYCSKVRDSQTGKLSGFRLDHGSVSGKIALIVDDICDGGGTFVGIAQELRKAGAAKVYLCVTHGLFTKGIALEGIDAIFTTDSYQLPEGLGYHLKMGSKITNVLEYIAPSGQVKLTVLTRFTEIALKSISSLTA